MKKVAAKFRLIGSIFLALLLAGCSDKKRPCEMTERVYICLPSGKGVESAESEDIAKLRQLIEDYLDSKIVDSKCKGVGKHNVILVTVYTSPTGSKAANAKVAAARMKGIEEILKSAGVDMSNVAMKHVEGAPKVGVEVEVIPKVEADLDSQVQSLGKRLKRKAKKAKHAAAVEAKKAKTETKEAAKDVAKDTAKAAKPAQVETKTVTTSEV